MLSNMLPDDACPTCGCRGCVGYCEPEDIDADATAEYGQHPAGEARWQALQAEITADAARPARAADVTDSEIPF